MTANFRAVPLPSRMRHLPRDRRGYPIPAGVYRDLNGTPHFTINDSEARVRHLAHDLCPICATKLLRGRWFVGGPLAAFHPNGAYIDLPMHHECAAYALQVCPYLAVPSYSGRVDAATLAKVEPEDRGAVLLLVDPMMIPDRPELFVCAMATGQHSSLNYIRPHRPWHRVEYWRDGAKLDPAEAEPIVQRILAAPVPPVCEPRLIEVT